MEEHAKGKMSPRAQHLVLRAIYGFDSWSGIGTTQAAKLLGKPKFTVMRAFDELAAIDPSLIKAEGKVRWLTPGANRKELLKKVAPRLFNPAIREYRLERVPAIGHMPLSGMSAIGHYEGLEKGPFPTFAMTKEQEKALDLRSGKGLEGWQSWDNPACIVQVMSYDLDSMGEAAIDPISAILTLSDAEMEDPRVEAAVMGVLEKALADR